MERDWAAASPDALSASLSHSGGSASPKRIARPSPGSIGSGLGRRGRIDPRPMGRRNPPPPPHAPTQVDARAAPLARAARAHPQGARARGDRRCARGVAGGAMLKMHPRELLKAPPHFSPARPPSSRCPRLPAAAETRPAAAPRPQSGAQLRPLDRHIHRATSPAPAGALAPRRCAV